AMQSTAQRYGDEVEDAGSAAAAATVAGERPVAAESAIPDREGGVIKNRAAVDETDARHDANRAAVAAEDLIARKRAVGEGRGSGLSIDEGPARGVAAAIPAARLVAQEGALGDGQPP